MTRKDRLNETLYYVFSLMMAINVGAIAFGWPLMRIDFIYAGIWIVWTGVRTRIPR